MHSDDACEEKSVKYADKYAGKRRPKKKSMICMKIEMCKTGANVEEKSNREILRRTQIMGAGQGDDDVLSLRKDEAPVRLDTHGCFIFNFFYLRLDSEMITLKLNTLTCSLEL